MATLRIDRKLRTRKRRVTILRGVSFLSAQILVGILLLVMAAAMACAQGSPDFSGLWKQENDRCQPKRNGDVTLRIEHHGPELTVETSISRHSSSPRQAVQRSTQPMAKSRHSLEPMETHSTRGSSGRIPAWSARSRNTKTAVFFPRKKLGCSAKVAQHSRRFADARPPEYRGFGLFSNANPVGIRPVMIE